MAAPSAERASGQARGREPSEPSGRLLLRMPSALHGALAQAATREGTSLNQFITGTLGAAIGWHDEAEGTPRPPAAGPGGRSSRTLVLLLVANVVAVGLAALAAVGLLLYALLG